MRYHTEFPRANVHVSVTANEEAHEIINLLKDVASWIQENKINQWDTLAIGADDDEIKKTIKKKKTYSVKRDGKIIATFTLYDKQSPWDRYLWGKSKDKATYIHRLAVARSEIGSGLGKDVLQWIENNTKNKTIRLDCVEDNEKLNEFYIKCGYEKQGSNHGFSLYQKTLFN